MHARTTRWKKSALLTALACAAATSSPLHARTWTNANSTQLWSDPLNWNPTGAPVAGDTIILTSTGGLLNENTIFNATTNLTYGSISIGHGNTILSNDIQTLTQSANNLITGSETVGVATAGGTRNRGLVNQSGGNHTVTGTLILGAAALDLGTYTLSGGALSAATLTVGDAGNGVLNPSAGTITVTGALTLGNATNGSGFVNLSGNASLSDTGGSEIIGSLGNANFTQSGGTNSITTASGNPSLYIANTANSTAIYNMQNGTLTIGGSGQLGVGTTGNGTLFQTGGSISANFMFLGGQTTSIANLTLSGGNLSVGSLFTFTGNSTISQSGGTITTSGFGFGGNATYSLSGNGTINAINGRVTLGNNVNTASNTTFTQSGGTFDLSGSTVGILSVGGTLLANATYNFNAGSLLIRNLYVGGSDSGAQGIGVFNANATTGLTVSGGITVYANGTLNGQFSTSASVIVNGGSINPGNPNASFGVGNVTVGSLTLNTGSRAAVGAYFLFSSRVAGDLSVSTSNGLNIAGPASIMLNGAYSDGDPIINYAGNLTGSASNLTVVGGYAGQLYAARNDPANHTIVAAVTTRVSAFSQIEMYNDFAPGAGGGRYSDLYAASPGEITLPVTGAGGMVAFYSPVTNTSDGSTVGVFRSNGTSAVAIARDTQNAPGIGGGTFNILGNFFHGPTISPSGQVFFQSTLSNTIDGGTSGLFRGDGATLVDIARSAHSVPGVAGAIFDTINQVISTPNVNNQVAFVSTMTGASNGATLGLFRGDASNITAIALNNQTAPGNGGGQFDVAFGAQLNQVDKPPINASGQVAFNAVVKNSTNGSTNGVFRGDGTTTVAIARHLQALPGAGGGTFGNFFSVPVMNDAGQVAFANNNLQGTTDGATGGMFRGDGSTVVVIARDKRNAPGAGGGTFGGSTFDFSAPTINNAGQVAFYASLTGTTDGSNFGIFRGDGASLTAIARMNQLAPGTGGGKFANSSGSIAPQITAGGQVLFDASIQGAPNPLMNRGLFLGDGQEIIPIAIAGQSINTVGGWTGSLQNSAFLAQSVNDFGQVSVNAIFAAGGWAQFLFTPTLHWRNPAAGPWDTSTNWTVGLTPAFVHDVVIDPATPLTISGPAANTTIKSLTLGSATSTSTLQLTTGNLKLNGPLTISGATNAWTSHLDLASSKLALEATAATKASALATLQNQVAFGRIHPAGITSSALPPNMAIAVLDNAALTTPFTTFGGLSVDTNSLLIAPELLGDANIDGHVDQLDLNTVLQNFGAQTPAWSSGNFDGAPTINLTDLAAVLNNFGASFASPHTAEPTPEPATLAAFTIPAALLLNRRRKPAAPGRRRGVGT